jgi:hypothetical protein
MSSLPPEKHTVGEGGIDNPLHKSHFLFQLNDKFVWNSTLEQTIVNDLLAL